MTRSRSMFWAVAQVAIGGLVVACSGGTRQPVDTHASTPQASASKPADAGGPVCHPIVSGCGCAYQCATGFRQTPDGSWEVTHDFQDSRLDVTTLERWCFDPAGHAYPPGSTGPGATRCMDVFFDRTPCGGECIPTAAYLGCHAVGDRCAP